MQIRTSMYTFKFFPFHIGKDYSSGRDVREPFSPAADESVNCCNILGRNFAISINIMNALNVCPMNSMSVKFSNS